MSKLPSIIACYDSKCGPDSYCVLKLNLLPSGVTRTRCLMCGYLGNIGEPEKTRPLIILKKKEVKLKIKF